MRCFCCSTSSYEHCCAPFISGTDSPQTAEQLMRSRFTAYAIKQYDYVRDTYSEEKRQGITSENLESSASGAHWFALKVHTSTHSKPSSDTVEFTAYYFENKHLFQLHETSRFIIEGGLWRYHDGTLHDDCGKIKYGRNLPCLCGNNKKFKQCCATKVR
ncbi:MAG: zinc chelation protein SecC [Alteromonas sp.]|nr:zinc chelation protein SecC [Alteromonas sp. MB-3u-76]MAI65130.1 zinc chelation protein SecC [Alteromonas sp.]